MPSRNLAQGDCEDGSNSDLDWGTSFAFSAICCAAAIILYFSPKGCHKVVPSYFLVTGISYAVLGLRQILDAKLSSGLQEALEMTSHILYGLGTILLLALSMMMVSINPRSESKVKMVTFWCLLGVIAGFMLVSIFLEAEMNSGVPLHASLSFGLLIILMSVYMFHMCWDRTKVWHYIAKALAVLIIAIEVLYSTIIASPECQKCSSTCQYSSSTGVDRPKMVTATRILPRSGSISSTMPF
jgi:FtsH-binding integral membrane protein